MRIITLAFTLAFFIWGNLLQAQDTISVISDPVLETISTESTDSPKATKKEKKKKKKEAKASRKDSIAMAKKAAAENRPATVNATRNSALPTTNYRFRQTKRVHRSAVGRCLYVFLPLA